MTVPYTFAAATGTIPLEELDINFATPITLGTTDLVLGDTVTSVSGLTLDSPTLITPNVGDVTSGTWSAGAISSSGYIRGTSATITSSASITPSANNTNQYTVTALATPATIQIPGGTPIDGQKLLIRLKDNGVAQALTWTTSAGGYRIIGTTLPTTTTAGKVTYVGCVYNSQDSYWDVIAVTTQA